MDLAEIVRVMRRRWYVLLPGLLLTAALVAGAYVAVPVTYQSQSTVMLLNSRKATVAYDGNPFLSSQTTLTGMADSLARNLNSDASLATLRSQGATGTTFAKIADNAQGPLMWLTVTGTDEKAVLTSDRLLTAYAAKRLQEFQDGQGVTPGAMIRMTTIVPPQRPVAQTKTRTEYLALAGLAGVAVSLTAAFYIEARGRGKAIRRAAAVAAAAADAPGPAGTDEPPSPARHARPAPRWSLPDEQAPAAEGSAPGDPAGAPAPRTEASRLA